MSFLAPLFLLGALAIAAPVVFHLIRRTPRGAVSFSSLMFLAPTPPRMTRRSRLDDWPLLLLRAAALGLLAAAFARPFLRQAASLTSPEEGRRRVAVLIDTSASLRRGDLWDRAKALADAAIAACRPDDQLALLAFDGSTRTVFGFDESATLEPSRRRALARARLARLAPSWGMTDLGRALVDAVGALEGVADASEKAGRMPRRVVLVTDLQQGSRLDALGSFAWPKDVDLEVKAVADPDPNASLRRLDDPAATGGDGPVRVRVTVDPGSKRESFRLAWVDAEGKNLGPAVETYVPPGEGRVVVVPRPPKAVQSRARALRLVGDAHPFDNLVYLAAGRRDEATVLFVGPDAADDASGLLYYLDRVFEDSPGRAVRVVARKPGTAWDLDPARLAPPSATPAAEVGNRTLPLVVLAGEVSVEDAGRLKGYLRSGGTVLALAAATGRGSTLAALADAAAGPIEEAGGRDAMLGEIAFDHPLFAPLAGAQFSDFTKVRFWKHRRLGPAALGAGARVLARFEGGDPAVVEKPVGRGRLVALASGWSPADSQLARSSKFVPLMAALLGGRESRSPADFRVNDPVPLPDAAGGPRVVRKPDGSTATPAPGDATFAGTDVPGVYAIEAGGISRPFAVNLDPAEGRTTPLAVETLEQLGCRIAGAPAPALDREQVRQMQNGELEGRQKFWRWLVLAAIGLLIVETWLAGRPSRPRPAPTEALAR